MVKALFVIFDVSAVLWSLMDTLTLKTICPCVTNMQDVLFSSLNSCEVVAWVVWLNVVKRNQRHY